MIIDLVTILFLLIGIAFVSLGTVGLIRMPDVHCRLHALTKADNLGLGFIVFGLLIQADSLTTVVKLVLIWAIMLLASTTACYLIAREGLRDLGGEAET